MFGQFTSNFFQGTRDESQRLRGERRKIADAFSQFKAQNPTATYADFRQFVDGMGASDSYYLRGAVPADDMLQELGRQNEVNRTNEAIAKQTQTMLSKLQNRQARISMVDNARKQGVRDPDKMLDYLVGELGIKDPTQDAEFRNSMRLLDLPTVFNDLEQQETDSLLDKYLPRIGSGLIGSESQLDELLPKYLKDTEAGARLRGQLGAGFKNYTETKHRALMSEGVKMLLEMGPDISFDNAAKVAKSIYGENFDPELVRGAAEQLYKTAQTQRDRASVQWEQSQDDRDAARAGSVRDNILADASLTQTILYSPDKAFDLVVERVRSAFPDWDEAKVITRSRDLMAGLKTRLGASQKADHEKLMRNLPAAVAKEIEGNSAAVGRLFKTAKPGAEATMAMQLIQSEGNWVNPSAVPGMAQLAKQLEAGGQDATAIQAALVKAFPRDIMDPSTRAEKMAGQLGAFEPQAREEYMAAAEADAEQGLASARQELLAIRKEKNPVARQQKLRAWQANVGALLNDFASEMTTAIQNQDRWALTDSRMGADAFARNLSALGRRTSQNFRALNQLYQTILAETPEADPTDPSRDRVRPSSPGRTRQ